MAVHLPQSISTQIEHHTINLLCDLLDLNIAPTENSRGTRWTGILTTGATAGNILGLATARHSLLSYIPDESFSKRGYNSEERMAKVYVAGGHSSISKACSILGIGRDHCIDVTRPGTNAKFNFDLLDQLIAENQIDDNPSVIIATFGEVNTGEFSEEEITLRMNGDYESHLVNWIGRREDDSGLWLHIDAAFGIMAALHPEKKQFVQKALQRANSISFDAHKFFNVPYDCGVFLTRDRESLTAVCGNDGAAYLSPTPQTNAFEPPNKRAKHSQEDTIESPLNMGIENSRRFRALPLYASLLSLGRDGYTSIVVRCCNLASALGRHLSNSESFEVLAAVEFNIVLFQAVGYETEMGNARARDAINNGGKVYVSGTVWRDMGALRIAVCNWLTPEDSEKEAAEVVALLEFAISSLDPNAPD